MDENPPDTTMFGCPFCQRPQEQRLTSLVAV
jgi:hypothetical protein